MMTDCKTCRKEFKVKPSVLKIGSGKYCSLKCRRTGEERKCKICDKEFYTPLNRIKEGKGIFCSKSCYNKYQEENRVNFPTVLIEKKCKECEQTFLPQTVSTQRWCSDICRRKAWEKRNERELIEKRKQYYKENKERMETNRRKNLSIREFGGNREAVVERDGSKCTDCGKGGQIVHHIDRDRDNNEMDNLTMLCRACHAKEHKENGEETRFKKGMKPWNKKISNIKYWQGVINPLAN